MYVDRKTELHSSLLEAMEEQTFICEYVIQILTIKASLNINFGKRLLFFSKWKRTIYILPTVPFLDSFSDVTEMTPLVGFSSRKQWTYIIDTAV